MAAPQVILENVKQTATTDSNGYWQVIIARNSDISPANTVYDVKTPFRSFQITIPAGAGPFQATSNLANAISVLSPATSNLTGPITVTGNETVTGTLTVQGATSLQAGATVAGGQTLTGGLALTDNASQIVPGSTSLSLRNHVNNADNLLMTDAGAATVRNGLTVSAGSVVVPAASIADAALSSNVPLKNAANTFSALQTISSGGLTVSAGPVSIPDTSLLFRKLQLENNVTRAYSQQAPGVAALTGAWANYGTALTITPAVNSLVIAWVSSSGVNGFAGVTDLYLRIQFNAANGLSGGGGVIQRVNTGANPGGKTTLSVFDLFVATAGAVTVQPQMQIGNNGNFTTDSQGLTIFALAIPST